MRGVYVLFYTVKKDYPTLDSAGLYPKWDISHICYTTGDNSYTMCGIWARTILELKIELWIRIGPCTLKYF